MPYHTDLPDRATMLDVYKLDMALAQPIVRYQQQIMRGPSPLSEGERELIAAYVSSLNACDFCLGVHAEVAGRFGVAEDTIARLADDGPSEVHDGKLAALLVYVGKLTREPSRMVQADARAVYDAGWDATALFHAVSVAGLFNFFNRMADGLGLDPLDADMLDKAAGGLHGIGYEGRL